MADTVRVWPGSQLSAGRDLGRIRHQLRSVLGARGKGRVVPVRRRRRAGDRARRPARVHPRDLARLPARRAPPATLRLPGVRAVRAEGRAPLQPPQAAARSVCQGGARHAALGRCRVRLPGGRPQGRPHVRSARQRAVHAQMPGHRPRVHLGARSSDPAGVARDDHLRDAPQGLHHAARRGGRGGARHLRRPVERAGGRLSERARRDRGRAAAGARLHPRPAPDRAGAAQLLGLQQHRLLRAARRVPRQRRHRRGQDLRPGDARRRDRGDPRRGLQPYRRGQPHGPDAVVPRDRQPLVLLSHGRPALLQRLHRHRQRARAAPPVRAAHGHRQPALLGRGDARRRLPLRSRDHARAGRGPVRRARELSRCGGPGPGARFGQADRRAVGYRSRRLSGRPFPAGLGRVERPVSRHPAQILEGRRGPAAGARLAPRGLGRHLPSPRPPALGEHQFRHRPRRFHAARSGQLQRQAQRGQQGGQPGRLRQQQQLELRRRGSDRRSRGPRAAPAPDAQFPNHPSVVARRADAGRPATSSAAPRAATTTPIARTARSAGSTGT